MPLPRKARHTSSARTLSSRSIVPATAERCAGSATNGVAYSLDIAQSYRIVDEISHRSTHQSSPPFASIHRNCSTSSTNVARAGVLYVWLSKLLSRAMLRSSDAGIHRADDLIALILSMAAGEQAASHSPP